MTARLESDRPSETQALDLAERVLGHEFSDRDLLRRALTHPSAAPDKDPDSSYERLEFLGDAIISYVVADEAFRRFPEMTEGAMTRLKISVVAGSVLARVARDLGLADALLLGPSEHGTGGRGMTSALENLFEALTAALYLDAGMEPTREWVIRTLGPLVTTDGVDVADTSPKSRLQERLQARGETPSYEMAKEEGPPHERTFTAHARVGDKVLGEGTGRTKKEAESAAAAKALARLDEQRGTGCEL
jgi:ribonuclease-3